MHATDPRHTLYYMDRRPKQTRFPNAVRDARAGLVVAASMAAACTAVLGIEDTSRENPPVSSPGSTMPVTPPGTEGDASGKRGWVEVYLEILKNEGKSPNIMVDGGADTYWGASSGMPAASADAPLPPFKAAAYTMGALYTDQEIKGKAVGPCHVLERSKPLVKTDRPFFGSVEISSSFCPTSLKVASYQTSENPVTMQVNAPGGQTVSFTASDGSIPGFGLRTLVVPNTITLVEPNLASAGDASANPRFNLDKSTPLRVRWSGGSQGKVRTTLYSREQPGNPIRRFEIYCDVQAATGGVDIPVEALAVLPDAGTAGVKTTFYTQLYQVETFPSGNYDVTLNVLSPVEPSDWAAVDIVR